MEKVTLLLFHFNRYFEKCVYSFVCSCACIDISGDDMDESYETKRLEDGSLYVRFDMPGVPKDNFAVSVTNGKVNVTSQAPVLSHDSGSRLYSADVVILSGPVDFPSHRVKTIIKNGVIRLLIPPV